MTPLPATSIKSFVGSALAAIAAVVLAAWPTHLPAQSTKMKGVSVVSTLGSSQVDWTSPVQQVGADWVAVMPYALGSQGDPKMLFDVEHQWLPRFEPYRELVHEAKAKGLKVMLKPMLWVQGSWAGGFDLATEQQWLQWEAGYRQYTLKLADMAQAEHVDLFCLGTELNIACKKRPAFFRKLLEEVRLRFKGKLTYAANWDDYLTVNLWDKVDYIGIDAYFPLSSNKLPSVSELKSAWLKHVRRIKTLCIAYKKQILFTEFGYRSIDVCCWEQWLVESLPHNVSVNLAGQANAYQAFFETFWEQEWFGGVFFWQWYTVQSKAGGLQNSDFTPQNKPAEAMMAKWFQQ